MKQAAHRNIVGGIGIEHRRIPQSVLISEERRTVILPASTLPVSIRPLPMQIPIMEIMQATIKRFIVYFPFYDI